MTQKKVREWLEFCKAWRDACDDPNVPSAPPSAAWFTFIGHLTGEDPKELLRTSNSKFFVTDTRPKFEKPYWTWVREGEDFTIIHTLEDGTVHKYRTDSPI